MSWKHYINRIVAAEISSLSRYYDQLVQFGTLPNDSGLLFDVIDCRHKSRLKEQEALPSSWDNPTQRTLILLNGVLNHHLNIQELLSNLKQRMARTTRLGVVMYNPYLRGVY